MRPAVAPENDHDDVGEPCLVQVVEVAIHGRPRATATQTGNRVYAVTLYWLRSAVALEDDRHSPRGPVEIDPDSALRS
ncbi:MULTISPECIES: hypothetical protein [unclassified Streptomyces]|uniref:hypothetical protein n=1 Tax=unclassified Streptomyces TaxID=2593676 RepID=UPI000366740B|nr:MULTISPECIES: hypothetical protein [unclassified Streptomyces]MYT29233.1 hypothetical protein [Streptomyces sp. SID8354]